MLRGTVYRGYRSRSRKRRRYSGRRRTYRNYRRKRSRLSLDQRMTMIAVKNATSSKRQYGWIARDLGTLFPEVLAVKLFQSAVLRWNNVNDFEVAVRMTPFRSIVVSTGGLVTSGYSSLTSSGGFTFVSAVPIGFSRVCGTSPTQSIYAKHKCLSVAYDIRCCVYPNAAQLPEAKTDTGFERQFPPWEHNMFVRPSFGLNNPTTQDEADVIRSQPSVRKQFTNGWSNAIHPGDPASSVAAYVPMEPRFVRWRGVSWAHTTMSVPFTQYLGDNSTWYGSTAPAVENAGAVPVVDLYSNVFGTLGSINANSSATYHTVYALVDVCYSVLFKTPLTDLANS